MRLTSAPSDLRGRTPPDGLAMFPFVLGFATALVLAAAVALYITQAPVPFVDRGIQRPQGSIPGMPTEAGQPPSRSGAQAPSAFDDEARPGTKPPPAPALALPPPLSAPPSSSPVTGPGPSSSLPATPPTAPPLGSTAPAGPAGQAASASQFFLQVAAFKSSEEAEQMRARLAFMGFEAQISEGKRDNLLFYRVRLGPYRSFEELNRVKTSLSDNGLESTVVRSPQ
jgi:cell division septation protein DedD